MKRYVGAALAAIFAVGALASTAEAQERRWRGRDRGPVIIQQAPSSGVDVNSLLLMQALGAGGTTGGAAALLPFLLTQPQQTTTVINSSRRRRF
jgi:hypothetical protein